MGDVKVPEDLQRIRRQIVRKQDQGNDGAVLLIVDELIDKSARAEQRVEELEQQIEKIKNPIIYTGVYYASVEVPKRCPDCDGRDFISKGVRGMVCHTCWLMQALEEMERENHDLGIKNSALQREVAALRAPVTDEEWEDYLSCTDEGYTRRVYVDKFIAARASTQGEKGNGNG